MGGLAGINKGKLGEREVADALNGSIYLVYQELKLPTPRNLWVQRNTQQSAIGGQDLTGTFGLCIEVKRQETLAIPEWWRQCVASANTLEQIPVLVFRQSKKTWRVIMEGAVQLPPLAGDVPWRVTRVEIGWDDFLSYFREYVKRAILIRMELNLEVA